MLRKTYLFPLVCLALLATTGRSNAADKVFCPPGGTFCQVVVDLPGMAAAAPAAAVHGKPNGAPGCRKTSNGEVVACFVAHLGWWSNAEGCYFQRLDPAPEATSDLWAGHFPAGSVYQTTCLDVQAPDGGWVWRATPPAGFGGDGVTVQQLADQAIASLALSGPDIGLAPDPAKTGLVGLPVWMWSQVAPTTWGPQTATASLPGFAVTATARATRIVWSMGNGQSVSCDNPGTPYNRATAATTSPTCGYIYTRSSADQPGGVYALTATTTWDIRWAGNGAAGQVTQTRTSAAQVRIGELQVLVS